MHTARRRITATMLAMSLAILLQVLAVLLYSTAIHDTEELYNAAHGWLILNGGLKLAFPLQYQPFCGGCTVDAVLGAGAFALLGPSILAWRLVGTLFFLLALLAGAQVARKTMGRRAAAYCAILFAFAPPAYQELALISNGNHPEGGALLMLEILLAIMAMEKPAGGRRELLLAGLGLLVGFGLFFLRSMVLGLVVLALANMLAPPRRRWWMVRLLTMPASLAAGLSPILLVRHYWGAWPVTPIYQPEEWQLSFQWVGHNLASLLLPVQIRGIWGDAAAPALSWLGLGSFGTWCILVVLLAAATTRSLIGGRHRPLLHGIRLRSAVLVLGTLLAFVLLYSTFRLSVWLDGQQVPRAQQLRYLGLVYPLFLVIGAMGLALLHGALGKGRGRLLTMALALALILPGILGRLRAMSAGSPTWTRQRLAPEWCFQEERVRGDLEILEAASRGSPLPLVPYSAGLLQGDPGFALKATDDLPLAMDGVDTSPGTPEGHAWYRGEIAGIIVRARDVAKGEYAFSIMVKELASRVPETGFPPGAVREAAWCHARSHLVQGGQVPDARSVMNATRTLMNDQAWSTARVLWATARGAMAARLCVTSSSTASERASLLLDWNPSCQAWVRGLDAESAGWGVGVSLAEANGAFLRHLEVRLPRSFQAKGTDSPSAAFQKGIHEGWSFGAATHWVEGGIPDLEIRTLASDGASDSG